MTKTLIICPHVKHTKPAFTEEARGLAEALKLEIVDLLVVNLVKITSATFFGKGKLEELQSMIAGGSVELVIIDSKLSPTQQRNLERKWNIKVIDRTTLIIEIFASRAKSKEGKLQVELASLNSQKTRLIRSWTHLERQRGGFGFMGGPGEQQIEKDRRLIANKIIKIKGDLEVIINTRQLHRKARKSLPYPLVALVGYTNAGKTTLFNYLTGASSLAEDMLFATLDPTMRLAILPSGRKIIVSDTVGFISDLPTELIAAFSATLEEVVEAELIIHVRDISHSHTREQESEVKKVLGTLCSKEKLKDSSIELLNKIDLLAEDVEIPPDSLAVSALSGHNCDKLLSYIDNRFADYDDVLEFTLLASDGRNLAWIHEHAEVLSREDMEDSIQLMIRISPINKARFIKQCPYPFPPEVIKEPWE